MKRLTPLALALSLIACSRSPAPPAAAAAPAAPAEASAPGAASSPQSAAVPAPTEAPATAPATSPAPAPAPAPTAAAAATAPPTAAPAPTLPELPVTGANATTAAHREQPLGRAEVTVIEIGAQFQVEVPVALREARLALLDADGAMVPAAGGAELGASWTRFHLAPDAPLVPGSRYALQIDGAVERNLKDAAGRAYVPARWSLLTAGEKPKGEPKKQKSSRRKR